MATKKKWDPPEGIPHRKLRRVKHRVDSTPGRVKGPTCRAAPLTRSMCRRSRSYKWREYPGLKRV